jgi:hypothetical protein
MKAKDCMQGLPIQNSIKLPVKGEVKSQNASNSLTGKSTSKVNENSGEVNLDSILGNSLDGKVSGEKNDFAALLNEVKSGSTNKNFKNNESSKEGLVELEGKEKKLNSKTIEINPLEAAIAKTGSSLDQLLNNLKKTNDSDVEQVDESKQNSLKKNLMNGQKNENSELKKDSPLDFLVKGAKENKVGEIGQDKGLESDLDLKNLTEKKPFFTNQAKIPNNLLSKTIETDSSINAKENLKLVSGEEFVDSKKAAHDSKQLFSDKMNAIKNNNTNSDDFDPSKVKPKDLSQMKGYQQGQNILNDSMIRNTKDLAFKEQKKGKVSSIDELLNPELKNSNELSMIKESPLPMMAAKVGDNGISLKNSEAPKVLDLSNIQTTNTNQLIEKISDYVMQSNVAGKNQIDLTVKHEQLGQFQIQVTKNPTLSQPNQIDMQIMTSNSEGHKFFVANEAALMKSLNQSGINLSDLRIVSGMTEMTANTFGESKQSSSFSQNQNGFSQSHQSFDSFSSGDFKQGSEKRKDLWNEYRERYGA